jgi:TM2 domain-containing membrane protein YozV
MNCANHAESPAVAYCRSCGKPLCSACSRDVRGVIYCEECLAAHISGAVPPGTAAVPTGVAPPPGTANPRLAFILGWIPGVGAMYNGEFAKGFIHVLIFATLIWLANPDHGNALFGLAIAAFAVYMPIEAYKTAKAREMGLPAPDPLGLNNLFGSTPPAASVPIATAVPASPGVVPQQASAAEDERPSRLPTGAIILIGLGVLFLLDELGALHFDWIWRFWPLILIALGVRILMQRRRGGCF